MKSFKKSFKVLAIALLLVVGSLLIVPEDVSARGRSGGFRSSSSRSSFSRSTPSRSKSYSSSRSKSTPSKSWGKKSTSSGSRSTTASKKKATADQAAYKKAVANKTAYKTKADATSAFKKNNASKYPSKYTTQPAARPSHIPATYNGQSMMFHNGGYGTWSGGMGIGVFSPYNTMTDMIMLNMLMSRNSYHYGGAPVIVAHRSGFSFLMLIGLVVVAVFVIGGICVYFEQHG